MNMIYAAALLCAAAAIFCSHRVALIGATMQDLFIAFDTIYEIHIMTTSAPPRNRYKDVVRNTCVQRIRETLKIHAFNLWALPS